ncbi:MAG TPA: SDR family oxidoreductase [Candidatus Gastranaerophilales bacterium]|nr:SDR family oxidoreductase [Candidatus Gastranaerophilales bacterium]
MSAKEKFVLITGASSGIGKITATMLAEKGFIVFAGVRKEADAENLKKKNLNIIPVFIDVNDHPSIEKAFVVISEKCGVNGLFGLINNAGVAIAGPLEFLPIEKLRFQMETNVIGQVKVIQVFLPLIRKAKGRIVNISSIAGFTAFPFKGAYCASKHALEAITDSLRRELSPWEIPVCSIEPGIIKTNIWEKSLSLLEETINEMPEQAKSYYKPFYDKLIAKTRNKVEKNAISPEHVAAAAHASLTAKNPKPRYLVGKDAKFLNLIKHLPDKLLDRCICSKIGINKIKCECE